MIPGSPPPIPSLPFLIFEEVRDASPYAGELFRRKFGQDIPADGYHFMTLYRNPNGGLFPVCYGHVIPFGDIGLGGGTCTDDAVLRTMQPEERAAYKAIGGPSCNLMRFGLAMVANRHVAVYAYCGDARAEMVDLRAGFEKTGLPHLLYKLLQPVHPVLFKALTAKAAAVGPF